MPAPSPTNVTFFATSADLRAWFEENHATATELWAGFYKKGTGKPSITWQEAVDEALCFGWIDSIRKSVDEHSYTNRLTPRKPRSTWSAANIKRVEELVEAGLMRSAGLAAFEARTSDNSLLYSYEQEEPELTPEETALLKANEKAWDYFQSKPPSYRHAALWWVVSPKRAETRAKRLSTLIADSEAARTIAPLTRQR